jgi:hypothetical protein
MMFKMIFCLQLAMNRLAAGKAGMSTAEVLSSSDPAARLADYSGAQYFFIPGKSTPAVDVASGLEIGVANLPPDGNDSSSDKECGTPGQSSRREQKADHVIKVNIWTHHDFNMNFRHTP